MLASTGADTQRPLGSRWVDAGHHVGERPILPGCLVASETGPRFQCHIMALLLVLSLLPILEG